MDLQKSFGKMTQRIAHDFSGHASRQLHKLDLESLLGTVGLQIAKRPRSLALPMLAAFGAGMAAGALLTPMRGEDLRAKVAAFIRSATSRKSGDGAPTESAIDGAPVASPYEQATRARRDEAAGPNGAKKLPRSPETPVGT